VLIPNPRHLAGVFSSYLALRNSMSAGIIFVRLGLGASVKYCGLDNMGTKDALKEALLLVEIVIWETAAAPLSFMCLKCSQCDFAAQYSLVMVRSFSASSSARLGASPT